MQNIFLLYSILISFKVVTLTLHGHFIQDAAIFMTPSPLSYIEQSHCAILLPLKKKVVKNFWMVHA